MTAAGTNADGVTAKAGNSGQTSPSVAPKAARIANGTRPSPEPLAQASSPELDDLTPLAGRGVFRGLHERLQIFVWQRMMYEIAKVSDVVQPHKAPSEADFVKPIPAARRYPWLADAPFVFSELTPISERHELFSRAAIEVMLWLKEWYAMGKTLTQLYRGTGAPYPKIFAELQAPPSIPEDFQHADRLGRIAARGPFSLQTQRSGPDEFVIDLRGLEEIQPRKPFITAGGLARFRRGEGNTLTTVQLEFRGVAVRPGEPGWSLTEKRFLTGLNSQTTVVEHLVLLHIATAGVWGIVSRLALSARHPLRILLQPFSEETNRVNNYNIDGLLLTENSNIPLYSGYTLEQASRLIRQAGKSFDIRLMDPECRARIQGQLNDPTFPTVESAVAVFQIYRRFAEAWCRTYLPELDLETRIFCQELDYRVANGVRKLIGIERWEELTADHVAHILAVGMFASSVGHHIANDLTRDYFMAFHVMPPALTADGYPTLGIVLEKQSSIFSANIQRYRLLAQAAIPDEPGQRLWNEFQKELRAYEAGLASDPLSAYRIHPSRVSSSIHA